MGSYYMRFGDGPKHRRVRRGNAFGLHLNGCRPYTRAHVPGGACLASDEVKGVTVPPTMPLYL
jgi:hypothetical protein